MCPAIQELPGLLVILERPLLGLVKLFPLEMAEMVGTPEPAEILEITAVMGDADFCFKVAALVVVLPAAMAFRGGLAALAQGLVLLVLILPALIIDLAVVAVVVPVLLAVEAAQMQGPAVLAGPVPVAMGALVAILFVTEQAATLLEVVVVQSGPVEVEVEAQETHPLNQI
jgi:hypothetical protein